MPASSVPSLALVVLVTTLSCTLFGMVLGSAGLQARDVFFVSNVVYFLMLLVCGVNVPRSSLPGWLQDVGAVLSLTHGIEAARQIAGGASLASVRGPVLLELGIGLAWGAVAYGLFRWFEREGRRHAALDRFYELSTYPHWGWRHLFRLPIAGLERRAGKGATGVEGDAGY